MVVFDNQLTPAQQRNLQKLFGCDVVDREGLILDIFAQHAHTKVGALQVELAMNRYNLPRLRGRGTSLSQQGAGVLARGPGETKLETDRRRILERNSKLERELKETVKHRETQRKSRKKSEIPQIAIVGLHQRREIDTAQRPHRRRRPGRGQALRHARLDCAPARTARPAHRLLADTVGFVRRLPHHLVEAFRSTLSEVAEADLLLHLVDGTDPDPAGQIAAVREVLMEIGAAEIPELTVINKADMIGEQALNRLVNLYPDAVFISALKGTGLEGLMERIGSLVERAMVALTLEIPYARGDLVAAVHRVGEVIEEKHDDNGMILEVRVPETARAQFAPFSR